MESSFDLYILLCYAQIYFAAYRSINNCSEVSNPSDPFITVITVVAKAPTGSDLCYYFYSYYSSKAINCALHSHYPSSGRLVDSATLV